MNLLCKLGFHKFGGFYLKDDNGEYFDPIIFVIPPNDALDVYKKCARCGEIYDQTVWGTIEKSELGENYE